jgi:hypothetical protein
MTTQLEIKSENPLKISGKGGTSGNHRRKKELKERNKRIFSFHF